MPRRSKSKGRKPSRKPSRRRVSNTPSNAKVSQILKEPEFKKLKTEILKLVPKKEKAFYTREIRKCIQLNPSNSKRKKCINDGIKYLERKRSRSRTPKRRSTSKKRQSKSRRLYTIQEANEKRNAFRKSRNSSVLKKAEKVATNTQVRKCFRFKYSKEAYPQYSAESQLHKTCLNDLIDYHQPPRRKSKSKR